MIGGNPLSMPVIPKGKKARGPHAAALANIGIPPNEQGDMYLAMDEGQLEVDSEKLLREGTR
jgi:hypothetical protein